MLANMLLILVYELEMLGICAGWLIVKATIKISERAAAIAAFAYLEVDLMGTLASD
jgi:hypothetical protein